MWLAFDGCRTTTLMGLKQRVARALSKPILCDYYPDPCWRCSQGLGGWWSTSLGSLVTGSPFTIPLSPGWSTSAAPTTTTPGGRATRSRRRVEEILWMTGEGVGEGNGADPVLGVEEKRSLSSQRPDAEEQIRLRSFEV